MINKFPPIVWIVHPRSIQDVEMGMPMLTKLPNFLKKVVFLCRSPYKAQAFNEEGQPRGYIVAVALLPIHFKKYKFFAAFRLSQAFKLAKRIGAKKVSVGGMITTLAERDNLGGKYGLEVFDGTDLLAQITTEKVTQLLNRQGANIKSVGIIGATTKTGSLLSKYLAAEQISELHLFARTAANVKKLAEECKKIGKISIIDHVDLESIGRCDLCILTAFIPGEGKEIINNLKYGSIFFSIIEPVSPFVSDIEKLRPDINLTRGIMIKAPSLSYTGMDFVIPSGSTFSCLAEAILADTKSKSSEPIEVKKLLEEHNFQIA